MELDQLRYFLQAARRGGFTKAAADLVISQSALSRSIQKLEEELGQPVFERKTRSVSLKEAGLLLQEKAQQVLALIEDTKAEITDDGNSGHVQIGAIPTIAPYFLPEVLGRFSTEFPGANLVVQELVSLAHGVSMIPEMARRRDQSDRRVYRYLVSPKPKNGRSQWRGTHPVLKAA